MTLENVLTDDRKALAGMGSKVLIWPDKLAFDTETGQLETLGQSGSWATANDRVPLRHGGQDVRGGRCRRHGAGEPGGRAAVLKGAAGNLYDYESVLEKWSAKSGKWVQVLVNTVRMTCPGIGSLLKEGDTVT